MSWNGPRRVTVIKLAVLVTGLALAGTQGMRLMEHKVSGATASETFTDPFVAKLAQAACSGDNAEVAQLVKSGASANGHLTRDGKNDVSPLMWSLSCENLAGFEALLKAGADPNLAVGQFAITPTFGAAGYHDPAFLRLVLKYGGDPNARVSDGDSALGEAFWLGHTQGQWDNYYALLDTGADINQPRKKDGIGLADFAATVGKIDKAVELLERGYSYDLDALAMAIYDNGLASTLSDGSRPGRDDPQYKYLGIAARMLKERGVDTERIKRQVDEKNKQVGAGIVQDYSFESRDPGQP